MSPAHESRLRGLATATYRQARRVVILTGGSSVLILGVVMLVTPGPAIVVIPLGLSILAIEFAWARRWLKQVKTSAAGVAGKARGPGSAPEGEETMGEDPDGSSAAGEAPRC